MVYSIIRSHLNVREEIIHSKSLIQRNFIHFPVLIVAKKNVKNGKNNLDKKNKERMNIINANKKNFLNKPRERWTAKELIKLIMGKTKGLLEGAKVIKAGIIILHPHKPRVVVVVVVNHIITSKL